MARNSKLGPPQPLSLSHGCVNEKKVVPVDDKEVCAMVCNMEDC